MKVPVDLVPRGKMGTRESYVLLLISTHMTGLRSILTISLKLNYLLRAWSPDNIASELGTYRFRDTKFNPWPSEKSKSYCYLVNRKKVEREPVLNYMVMILQRAEGGISNEAVHECRAETSPARNLIAWLSTSNWTHAAFLWNKWTSSNNVGKD